MFILLKKRDRPVSFFRIEGRDSFRKMKNGEQQYTISSANADLCAFQGVPRMGHHVIWEVELFRLYLYGSINSAMTIV